MTDSYDFPGPDEVAAARESRFKISKLIDPDIAIRSFELVGKGDRQDAIELPMASLRLLVEILDQMAEGNAVKVVPVHAELTTQDCADILNVSRPHVVKLLEQGALRHTMAGRHRRVKFADLMAFKQKRDGASAEAMNSLAAQAQDLGMGY
jgi:excisionase family DNA binding protein